MDPEVLVALVADPGDLVIQLALAVLEAPEALVGAAVVVAAVVAGADSAVVVVAVVVVVGSVG